MTRYWMALIVASALVTTSVSSAEAMTPKPGVGSTNQPTSVSDDYRQTLRDIEMTLGIVPTFLRMAPAELLPGAWAKMKSFELSQTNISHKYKELIAISVAAQIPCSYCVYWHTEAARLHGATDDELREALAVSGSVRQWSSWVANSQVSAVQFRADSDRIAERMKQMMTEAMRPGGPMQPQAPGGMMGDSKGHMKTTKPAVPTDAASTAQNIEATFGFVPSWMSNMPPAVMPGAWNEMQSFYLSPQTAIPNKYKRLIGIAVASQVPSSEFSYFETRMATGMCGATAEETQEAAWVAGQTRFWSTILNGAQTDPDQFRRETQLVMAAARQRMQRPGGPVEATPPMQRDRKMKQTHQPSGHQVK